MIFHEWNLSLFCIVTVGTKGIFLNLIIMYKYILFFVINAYQLMNNYN